MARARERLWENAPPEVDCDDPDTWVGPIQRYNEEGTGNVGSEYSWKYKGIGAKIGLCECSGLILQFGEWPSSFWVKVISSSLNEFVAFIAFFPKAISHRDL